MKQKKKRLKLLKTFLNVIFLPHLAIQSKDEEH